MKLQCKYLISSFIIVACCLLQQCCLGQSTTVRPYKFGFTIDEQQHRSEQRDERGIVMGEFGFITADGIYHVTVYATDEQGRFRILAMKNYPYESPPKTVEVMVKPKIPPKTTTTAKPLPRHNFNNEACSGCFLTNGNNKPKGLNGIEDKTVKNDIRPLSKTLTSSSSAANPKLPPTGKISVTNDDLLSFNLHENVLNLNTPQIESVAFRDLNELKNAVKNQQFNTTPLILAHNKVILSNVENDNKLKTQSIASNKQPYSTNPITLAPNIVATVIAKENLIKTKSLGLKDNVKSMALNDAAVSKQFNATPSKVATNVVNNNKNNHGTILSDHNESISKTLEKPLQQHTSNVTPLQLHKTQHDQHKHQTPIVTLSNNNINNKDTPLILVYNVTNSKKIKPITFLKHDLNLQINSATQENILTKTPKEKSSERPVESQANTSPNIDLQNSLEPPLNTQLQGNILQNLPAATHTAQPATVNQNSGKSSVQNLPNTRLNTRYTSTPTTGQKTIQTPTTTNILQTTYTTIKPITSKDTNQKRPKPTQGSSSSVSTATKTATGNPPPIMDIIMQKVLPALMGNKGQQPSSAPTTTLNSKPNVVTTGKKTSATTSGTTANRKTGGSSGSTSLNGDGDLYRFKYILDYHGHSETGKRNGNKEGSYFSIGDDDVERTIEYVANEFGYQPRIRWRKLDPNEIKSKENTLKDYEFVWFNL